MSISEFEYLRHIAGEARYLAESSRGLTWELIAQIDQILEREGTA